LNYLRKNAAFLSFSYIFFSLFQAPRYSQNYDSTLLGYFPTLWPVTQCLYLKSLIRRKECRRGYGVF